MRGAIFPLPQYAFMTWCSVKKSTGTTLLLPLRTKFGRFGHCLHHERESSNKGDVINENFRNVK